MEIITMSKCCNEPVSWKYCDKALCEAGCFISYCICGKYKEYDCEVNNG